MRDKLIIGIIVLVALVLGYAIWHSASKPGQSTQTANNLPEVPKGSSSTVATTVPTPGPATTSPTAQLVKKPSTTVTTKKPAATSVSATQTYVDALKIYKTSGYYFQFLNCHGTPGSLTLKKGKKFMLDNRDPVSHKIVFANQTYNIGGYGFAVATALNLGKYYITCDGGGAASILVQP